MQIDKNNLKKIKRENRGQVSVNEQNAFIKFTDIELINLLKSTRPTERTCAAKILGNRKSISAINTLCEAIKLEKSLYPRIAISEALGEIGLPALPELIKLLGKIGNNQYKNLPDKPFKKKSYPLPRDIVTRCITKIGEDAIELLIALIPKLNREMLLEAIDAVGFISFYYENKSAFETVKQLILDYEKDNLILWKLLRALQAFPNQESIEILETYCGHYQIAIVWEAERSIAQIKNKITKRKRL